MIRLIYALALFIPFCCVVAQDHDQLRTWTDDSGHHRTQARFLGFDEDGRLKMEKEDGSAVLVPWERVSEADRQFVLDNSYIPLGIDLVPIDESNRHDLGPEPPVDEGIIVAKVLPGSVAEASGIKKLDVIAKVRNDRLVDADSVRAWLAKLEMNESVRFPVFRFEAGEWKLHHVLLKAERVPGKPAENVTASKGVANAAPGAPAYGLNANQELFRIRRDLRASIEVGTGEMGAQMDSPTVYIPLAGPPTVRWNFVDIVYLTDGADNPVSPTEGYFDVDGVAEKVGIRSSDPLVVKVTSYGESDDVRKIGPRFDFLKEGSTDIVVSLAGKEILFPLTVKNLPVRHEDTADAVIKALGLPTKKDDHYVSWPDTEEHDNVIYRPDARQRSISASHWRFDKHPLAVVSIVDGKVYRVSTGNAEEPPEEFLKRQMSRMKR